MLPRFPIPRTGAWPSMPPQISCASSTALCSNKTSSSEKVAVMSRMYSVSDYEKAARRLLPHCVWEYLQGGTEDMLSRDRNRSAFHDFAFTSRVLRDVSAPAMTTEIFGERYSMP